MSSWFVLDRTEICRWGSYRVMRDTMRKNRQRGDATTDDRPRWWAIRVDGSGGCLRAVLLDGQLADQLASGDELARAEVVRRLDPEREEVAS